MVQIETKKKHDLSISDQPFIVGPAFNVRTLVIENVKMKTAKLFRNGQSRAVRLPKAFRFEGDEVFIKKSGSAVVFIPLVNSWDSLIGSLDKFSKDYLVDRDQPKQQQRESSVSRRRRCAASRLTK